jgi:hypothetical protein
LVFKRLFADDPAQLAALVNAVRPQAPSILLDVISSCSLICVSMASKT